MDAEAYADMLPWLVFLVIDRRSGLSVAWAAGCATLASAGLAAWSYWRGRQAPLPRVALAFFAPCYLVAVAVPAWDSAIGLTRSVALLSLGLAAFISLRFTPISQVYTTPLVAPGIPARPGFRRVNVEMTSAWGVGSLVASITCVLAMLVQGTFAFTFMDWVIPLLIATGTILWSNRRWELFRLSLDGSAELGSTAPPPLHLRNCEPADTAALGPRGADHRTGEAVIRAFDDAVIRELPVRRTNRAMKRRTL